LGKCQHILSSPMAAQATIDALRVEADAACAAYVAACAACAVASAQPVRACPACGSDEVVEFCDFDSHCSHGAIPDPDVAHCRLCGAQTKTLP
jgi:hypothetical protein